ncbi:hypothetical protein BDZ85DRAFT_253669 [Elsinoe ampelina]|uniref:Uncharacterized protein n=1 Tax=Elsinoe ampelina TaxID=302913 RepID=A0A6A6FXT9_9PEZI|nr:hypothetical protein BDZ85DRAFT_253669 [Elsinoe ampelina]
MTDVEPNVHALYDAQDQAADEYFNQADWDPLADLLQHTLSDPAMPRLYRVKYHALSVFVSEDADTHIMLAKESINDIVQVILAEDTPQEDIDRRLQYVRRMVEVAEAGVIDADVDEQ